MPFRRALLLVQPAWAQFRPAQAPANTTMADARDAEAGATRGPAIA